MSTHRVFTCPVCDRGSTSEADAEDGYCGNCHERTGVPVWLTVGTHKALIGHLDRTSPEPIAPRVHEFLQAVAAQVEASYTAQVATHQATYAATAEPSAAPGTTPA